jgi:hypothetical protein
MSDAITSVIIVTLVTVAVLITYRGHKTPAVRETIIDPNLSLYELVQQAEYRAAQYYYREHPEQLPNGWVHRGASGLPEALPKLPADIDDSRRPRP